jgi:hypothetical protein
VNPPAATGKELKGSNSTSIVPYVGLHAATGKELKECHVQLQDEFLKIIQAATGKELKAPQRVEQARKTLRAATGKELKALQRPRVRGEGAEEQQLGKN